MSLIIAGFKLASARTMSLWKPWGNHLALVKAIKSFSHDHWDIITTTLHYNVKAIMLNSEKLEEIAFAEDHVVIPMTYIYNYMSIQPFHFMALFSPLL